MEKYWYVILEGSTLGPFDLEELSQEPRFNPDTLVWKEGFADWTPARSVPELEELFKDKGKQKPPTLIVEEPVQEVESPDGALVMVDREPPFFLIWLLIALLMLAYLISEIYSS